MEFEVRALPDIGDVQGRVGTRALHELPAGMERVGHEGLAANAPCQGKASDWTWSAGVVPSGGEGSIALEGQRRVQEGFSARQEAGLPGCAQLKECRRSRHRPGSWGLTCGVSIGRNPLASRAAATAAVA